MGHGDAVWPEDHGQARRGGSGARVRSLRRADRVHPAGHGGLVRVPARPAASLVGLGSVVTNPRAAHRLLTCSLSVSGWSFRTSSTTGPA